MPDGVTFVEHLMPDPLQLGLSLSLNAPRQFQERARYLLSIEVDVSVDNPDTAWPERAIRLLGYTRLK